MKSKKGDNSSCWSWDKVLPATKAMPKEMLPIVDKPTIQYIVEEAIESGIEDIIIVTGKGKRAIEDHFDHSFELEQNLLEKASMKCLKSASIFKINIHYIRQKNQKDLDMQYGVLVNLLEMNRLRYYLVMILCRQKHHACVN